MDNKTTERVVEADTRLASTPCRKTTLMVPDLVLDDLDQRINAMESAGKGRIARGDVLAALLIEATRDAGELADLVERYRRMTAGEFNREVRGDNEGRVISLPSRRGAGRPPG